MNIEQIIEMLENKIKHLIGLQTAYYQSGDLELYNKCSMDIDKTQLTLDKIKSLNH